MEHTANEIIAGVLGGLLPEDVHNAMCARFWELFPQFERMRGVVELVIAQRRVTASLLAINVLEIKERRKAERDAVWDELLKTLLDGYDGSPEAKETCERRLENANTRSNEITDDEIENLRVAYRKDTEDFERCYKLLVWSHERESMMSTLPKVHCT